MLRWCFLIGFFVTAGCKKKCYHEKCETSRDEFKDCDQRDSLCIKWDDPQSYDGRGRCEIGYPTIDGYIYCDTWDDCAINPDSGQAMCVVDDKEDGKATPSEVGLGLTPTAKIVLITFGAVFLLVVVGVICVYKKSKPGRFDRQTSINRPLVEAEVEVSPDQPPVHHPPTQYPLTHCPSPQHPPVTVQQPLQHPPQPSGYQPPPPPYEPYPPNPGGYPPPSVGYQPAQYPPVPYPSQAPAQYPPVPYPSQAPAQCPPVQNPSQAAATSTTAPVSTQPVKDHPVQCSTADGEFLPAICCFDFITKI